MNMTTKARLPEKSSSETVCPSVSDKENSGAGVPKGNMVEGVKAMIALLSS
jgi:hypothetical protein